MISLSYYSHDWQKGNIGWGKAQSQWDSKERKQRQGGKKRWKLRKKSRREGEKVEWLYVKREGRGEGRGDPLFSKEYTVCSLYQHNTPPQHALFAHLPFSRVFRSPAFSISPPHANPNLPISLFFPPF